jgi:hypothetical protein
MAKKTGTKIDNDIFMTAQTDAVYMVDEWMLSRDRYR